MTFIAMLWWYLASKPKYGVYDVFLVHNPRPNFVLPDFGRIDPKSPDTRITVLHSS